MGRSLDAGGLIPVRIAVVTLFPQMLREAMTHGVMGRALERGVVEVGYFDPRAFTGDVHRTVDDRPYGGGPGMVLKVEPLRDALQARAKIAPQVRHVSRAEIESLQMPPQARKRRTFVDLR